MIYRNPFSVKIFNYQFRGLLLLNNFGKCGKTEGQHERAYHWAICPYQNRSKWTNFRFDHQMSPPARRNIFPTCERNFEIWSWIPNSNQFFNQSPKFAGFWPGKIKGGSLIEHFFSRVNFQGVKKGPSQKTDFPVTAARGQIDLRILIYEVRFCEISLNYTIYSKNNR